MEDNSCDPIPVSIYILSLLWAFDGKKYFGFVLDCCIMWLHGTFSFNQSTPYG